MSTEIAKVSVSPEHFNIYPSSAPESCIQVTNVSFVPVLYRALSTAPKQFQVRPRQGIIESGKSETIVITYSSKSEEAMAAAASGLDRKEEFKIEYVRKTAEHDAAIAAAHGNASVVTDLIKASPKAEKKSRVVSCTINIAEKDAGKSEPAAASAAPPQPTPSPEPTKATTSAAAATVAAPPAATAPQREATTDILTGASESKKEKAPSTVPTSAVAASSSVSKASAVAPSAVAEDTGLRSRNAAAAASAPSLPPPRQKSPVGANVPATAPAAQGGAVASFASDPIGYLQQNPVAAVVLLGLLYILGKILF